MTNPLTDFAALPHFDQILPDHIGPAIDQLLAEAESDHRRAQAGRGRHAGSGVVP